MRRSRVFLLLLPLAIVCSYTNVAAQQQSSMAEAQHLRNSCLESYALSELNPILVKLPFDSNKITPTHLADKTKPTAKEKAALEKYFTLAQECQEKVLDWVLYHSPDYYMYWLDATLRRDQISAALYQGRITYGEAATLAQGSDKILINDLERIQKKSASTRNIELQRQTAMHQAPHKTEAILLTTPTATITAPPPPDLPSETTCWWTSCNLLSCRSW